VSAGLRWRGGLLAATLLFFGLWTAANFVSEEQREAAWYWPDEVMRLGLDLKGGIHWVLGVKLDVAIEHELDYLKGRLEEEFKEEGLAIERVGVEDRFLVIEVKEAGGLARARELTEETEVLEEAEDGAERVIRFHLSERWQREIRERGISQVLEVMRRRIDDPVHGIPDSVVTRQGADRILVQIPAGQMDRELARSLLKTNAFLEFKLVVDQAPSEALLKAKFPDGLPKEHEIVVEREPESDRIVNVYLVSERPNLTGEFLSDARVGFDRQQRPIVLFTFNAQGAETFGELTEKNVGKQLAIVLDNEVASAPAIRSRIGAHGQIEGRFTSQEAAHLANLLRSGALSVPVEIEEERTIGPALGADSIRRGAQASIVGMLLVVLFAGIYYRLSGLFASVALACNLIFIVGIMSMAQATLTLPGIAGVVLTIGMAIDGNVIIFERIREELLAGKLPRAAVQAGFKKVFWTIFDANLTTLITGVILFEFGTGPIKGFAVTLSIGIVTSVFAVLVLTRFLYSLYLGERRLTELSI